MRALALAGDNSSERLKGPAREDGEGGGEKTSRAKTRHKRVGANVVSQSVRRGREDGRKERGVGGERKGEYCQGDCRNDDRRTGVEKKDRLNYGGAMPSRR